MTQDKVFAIPSTTPVIPFPNPAMPGRDFYIQFALTQDAKSAEFRLYTRAYRLIRQVKLSENLYAGMNVAKITGKSIGDIGAGSYYFVILAKNSKGEQAVSKAGIIQLLK